MHEVDSNRSDNSPWSASEGPDHAKLAMLRVPFPPSKISKKPVSRSQPGVYLDYVGHADITERLLEVDPEWNWSPCQWEDGMPKFVKAKDGQPVGLWIRLTVCGLSRLGFGSVEPGARDAEKQLIGDALRNAAMRFGVALDLWSKSEASQSSAAPAVKSQRIETQIRPPAPKREEDVVSKMADAFDGEEEAAMPFDEQTGEVQPGVDNINGVQLTVPYDPEWAYSQVLPFGKHKGLTIRAIASNKDGAGYLRWLVNKIAEQNSQGKRPSEVEQAVMIAWDHQSGKA